MVEPSLLNPKTAIVCKPNVNLSTEQGHFRERDETKNVSRAIENF